MIRAWIDTRKPTVGKMRNKGQEHGKSIGSSH